MVAHGHIDRMGGQLVHEVLHLLTCGQRSKERRGNRAARGANEEGRLSRAEICDDDRALAREGEETRKVRRKIRYDASRVVEPGAAMGIGQANAIAPPARGSDIVGHLPPGADAGEEAARPAETCRRRRAWARRCNREGRSRRAASAEPRRELALGGGPAGSTSGSTTAPPHRAALPRDLRRRPGPPSWARKSWLRLTAAGRGIARMRESGGDGRISHITSPFRRAPAARESRGLP